MQKKHSILRNYPVIGYMRFLMEFIRAEKLEPGQLLDDVPESWAADWTRADPDRFRP